VTFRPPSLFLRLLLLTLPVEALILGLFGIWLVRSMERANEAAFDEKLRVQMEVMLGGTRLDSTGRWLVDGDLYRTALAPGTCGCLLDGRGAILWESPRGWFKASGISAPAQEVTETLQTLSTGGTWARVLCAARTIKGDQGPERSTGPLARVVLARPLSELERSSGELRRRAAATGAALLGLTAALLWVAIRAGLYPVRKMVRDLRGVPGPDGMDRLDEGLVPWEMWPLAREINGLSDRLWVLVQLEKRFAAEAAHELRTPITLVKSTLQTALLAGGSREDYERALHEALEDLSRLEGTAESLLVLARADALFSKQPPAREDVPLHELLRAVAERFSQAAQEKGLEVVLELAPCAARGDRAALERLFINLADNAVKYTRPGGSITFRCAASGPSVLAAVEDTGPAIPEEERPYLFQPFFRGASGRAAMAHGAGLGLSIAAAVARLHDAQLAYEPSGGWGNRFTVRFPARQNR
jgi:signal transduction histidine kinase